MNFAAVWKGAGGVPVPEQRLRHLLPAEEQTASESYAIKAKAYGMPGTIVDGNDLLAVRKATVRGGRAPARKGGGPTLIRRRRPSHGRALDLRRSVALRAQGAVRRVGQEGTRSRASRSTWRRRSCGSPRTPSAIFNECMEEVGAAAREAEAVPRPALETIFTDVYASMPAHLRRQGQAAFDLAGAQGRRRCRRRQVPAVSALRPARQP